MREAEVGFPEQRGSGSGGWRSRPSQTVKSSPARAASASRPSSSHGYADRTSGAAAPGGAEPCARRI